MKFSSAHFTLFLNDAEPLHGHNYQVEVALSFTGLDDFEMCVEFDSIKAVLREQIKTWDEKTLIPKNSSKLKVLQMDTGHVEVRTLYSIVKQYMIPSEDVVLLECKNVTTESLARLFLEKLKANLSVQKELYKRIRSVAVIITETPGQSVEIEMLNEELESL